MRLDMQNFRNILLIKKMTYSAANKEFYDFSLLINRLETNKERVINKEKFALKNSLLAALGGGGDTSIDKIYKWSFSTPLKILWYYILRKNYAKSSKMYGITVWQHILSNQRLFISLR